MSFRMPSSLSWKFKQQTPQQNRQLRIRRRHTRNRYISQRCVVLVLWLLLCAMIGLVSFFGYWILLHQDLENPRRDVWVEDSERVSDATKRPLPHRPQLVSLSKNTNNKHLLERIRTSLYHKKNRTLHGESSDHKEPQPLAEKSLLSQQRRKPRAPRCKGVFFWGGGKAGSTNLAMLLKHTSDGQSWDPNGIFVDMDKEVCWADRRRGANINWLNWSHNKCGGGSNVTSTAAGKDSPPPQRRYVLDACPSYYRSETAERILKRHPEATFLMLIRDPVDRIVSDLNDRFRRGQLDPVSDSIRDRIDAANRLSTIGLIEQHAQAMLERPEDYLGILQLSRFGSNLQQLLLALEQTREKQCQHRVLIVPTDAMTRDPQQVRIDVWQHIGAGHPPPADSGNGTRVLLHANRGSANKEGHVYQTISNHTKRRLQEYFTNDVAQLVSLVGRNFSWDWRYSPSHTDWYTTTPLGTMPHMTNETSFIAKASHPRNAVVGDTRAANVTLDHDVDDESLGSPTPCQSIFYWGGEKSGSTTLAVLLKHTKTGEAWDPNGQFVDLGKEVCWAIHEKGGHPGWLDMIRGQCRIGQQRFALDGCPFYYEQDTAIEILTHYPDAKFLMLVRDPIDRMVSYLNARYGWRHFHGNEEGKIETLAQEILARGGGKPVELSRYGRNLYTLLRELRDPRQVLLLQTGALHDDPQGVIDAVMKHIGGKHKDVQPIHANDASRNKEGWMYQQLRNETRAAFQDFLRADVELLEFLVGRPFSWSWTKTSSAARDSSSWLASYVRSDLDLNAAKMLLNL